MFLLEGMDNTNEKRRSNTRNILHRIYYSASNMSVFSRRKEIPEVESG